MDTIPHIAYTVCSNERGLLTKAYTIGADGSTIATTYATLSRGAATHCTAATLHDLADQLDQLTPSQAIAWGVPLTTAPGERVPITTQTQLEAQQRRSRRTIARDRAHFGWADTPSVVMLDVDYDHIDLPDRSPEAIRAHLIDAVPELAGAAMLWRPSSSSYITDAARREVAGLRGQRIYVVVSDGALVEALGALLMARLWLRGLFGYIVGARGQLLERGLVDAAVWQPERLDFAAGAALPGGWRQERKRRVWDGDYITEWQPLTEAERVELARLQAAAREAIRPQQRTKQREARHKLARRYMERGVSARGALRAARMAIHGGTLPGDHPLYLADGTIVTVAEVLAQPAAYNGKRCADPIDPTYRNDGRIALVRLSGGEATIYSHAHGGIVYQLTGRRRYTGAVTPPLRQISRHAVGETVAQIVTESEADMTAIMIPAGAGKTRAIREAADAVGAEQTVIPCPTVELAQQTAQGLPGAVVVVGRDQQIDGKAVCERQPLFDRLAAAGVPAKARVAAICVSMTATGELDRCPHTHDCDYWARHKAAQKARFVCCTHALMTHSLPITPDLIVIDESPLGALVPAPRAVSVPADLTPYGAAAGVVREWVETLRSGAAIHEREAVQVEREAVQEWRGRVWGQMTPRNATPSMHNLSIVIGDDLDRLEEQRGDLPSADYIALAEALVAASRAESAERVWCDDGVITYAKRHMISRGRGDAPVVRRARDIARALSKAAGRRERLAKAKASHEAHETRRALLEERKAGARLAAREREERRQEAVQTQQEQAERVAMLEAQQAQRMTAKRERQIDYATRRRDKATREAARLARMRDSAWRKVGALQQQIDYATDQRDKAERKAARLAELVAWDAELMREAARLVGQRIVLLDATGREEIMRALFPDMSVEVHRVGITDAVGCEVVQVADMAVTQSQITPKTDDGRKVGGVVGQMAALMALTGGALVGQMRLTDQLAALGCEPERMAHYNALRGLNRLSDADTLIVAGRTMPRVEAVELMARALWPGEQLDLTGHYERMDAVIPMRDGSSHSVTILGHRDPRCAAVLAQMRDDELAQAVARGRYIHGRAGRRLIIVGTTPVPGVVVDRIESAAEYLPSQALGQAVEIAGQLDAVPLGGKQLHHAAVTRGVALSLDVCHRVAGALKGCAPLIESYKRALPFGYRSIGKGAKRWSEGLSLTGAALEQVTEALAASLGAECDVRDYAPPQPESVDEEQEEEQTAAKWDRPYIAAVAEEMRGDIELALGCAFVVGDT